MRGKGDKATERNPFREDHPRLCGEKLVNVIPCRSASGSPPPMRGKGLADESREYRTRITPAYAGKSRVFALKTIP